MNWRGAIFAARKKLRGVSNGIKGALVRNAPKVAIVSCDRWKGKVYDDLLLQEEFLRRGMKAKIVSWQDSGVDWKDFKVAIVGSMWGYQNYLQEFKEWLGEVEKETVLVNPVAVIRENYDKAKQLRMLEKAGIPIIKTQVVGVGKLENFKLPEGKFVIKPAISGSGEGTFLIKDGGDLERMWGELEELNKTKELLAQPFVPEIRAGEIGVVVIGGEIVNVVRRFPGVIEGGYKVQLVPKAEISQEMGELVREIVELPAYKEAIYLRIDLVERKEGPVVMEVEALEPQLYYYLLRGEARKKVLEKMVAGVGSKVRFRE